MSEGSQKRGEDGHDMATSEQKSSGQNDHDLATPKQKSGGNSQKDPDLTTQKPSDNGVSSLDDSSAAAPKQSSSGQNGHDFATPKKTRSGRNSQNDPDLVTPKQNGSGRNSQNDPNLTPRRSSQLDNSGSSLKAANDDDAERHSRQQEILQQLTADNLESPATPSSRRMSAGIAPVTLTDVQLAEHYASCIRLANENKITTKNAFQLHLIDHLRKVLIAKDGTTNFITAGCTLDASAKIYAHRVDYVHAEAFHIAGELGLASRFRKRIMKGRREAVGEDADPDNPQAPAKGAQKKPRRRANTLVRNEKTISVQKVETGKPVDPLEEYVRANSTYGTSDCFFLNHIHTFSDRGDLVYLDIKKEPEPPMKQTFSQSPVEFFRLLGGVRQSSATCPDRALQYMWCDDSMEEERYDGYDASESFFQFDATASIAATEEPMAAMPSVAAVPSVCGASAAVDCDGAAPADHNVSMEEEEEGDEGPVDILKNGISELAKYIAPEKREYTYFVDNAPPPNAAEYWRARLAEKAKKATKAPERKHKKAEKIVPMLDFGTIEPDRGDLTPLKKPPVLDKATRTVWKRENNLEPFLEEEGEVNLTNLILVEDIKITLHAAKPVRLGNFGKRLHDQDNEDFCPDVNEDSNMYVDNAGDAPPDAPPDVPGDAPADAPPDASVDPPAMEPAVDPPAVDPPAVQAAVKPPGVGPAMYQGPNRFVKPLPAPTLKPIYEALGAKYSPKAAVAPPKFQPSYKRVDMKDMKKAIWQTLSSGRTLIPGKGNAASKGTKVDKGNAEEADKKTDPRAADNPEGGPSAADNPEGGPSAADNPEGGQSAADNPEGGPSAADNPEGGPSAADNPEGGPSAADNPEGGPSAADYPEGGPSAANNPEGSPSAADNPEGGPSAAGNPEGGPSAADNPEGASAPDNPEGASAPDNPEGASAPDNPEGASAPDYPGIFGAEKKPEEAAAPGIHSFRRVYKHLKPRLNRLNRQNVSVPTAFVALLHLANEKGFYVHSTGDLSDVDIEMPEPE